MSTGTAPLMPYSSAPLVSYTVGTPVPYTVGAPVPYTSDTFNNSNKVIRLSGYIDVLNLQSSLIDTTATDVTDGSGNREDPSNPARHGGSGLPPPSNGPGLPPPSGGPNQTPPGAPPLDTPHRQRAPWF